MIRADHPQAIETSTSQPATSSPAVSRSPKAARKPKESHCARGGSSEANRQAVVILEVLAGIKTPTQAASDLSITPPLYYQLETRAVEGLVAALEPKPKGKQPLPANRIAALERELEKTRRECARQQALARITQRTWAVKLAPRPQPKPKPAAEARPSKSPEPRDGAGRRRRRRPAVRALKAVQALRKNVRPAEEQAVQQPAPTEASAPPREPVPMGV